MKTYQSYSSAATKKLGKKLAEKIISSHPRKNAAAVALIGELGSGKTTFAQGFVTSLKPDAKTSSPTFIIMKKFAIRAGKFENLFHIDGYRLKNPRELLHLGFKEIIRNPKNIVLIEWADKIKKLLPKSAIKIYFEHGQRKNERIVRVATIKI